MRDLDDVLPTPMGMVIIRVLGKTLLAALENGVSKVPSTDGRFPQVR